MSILEPIKSETAENCELQEIFSCGTFCENKSVQPSPMGSTKRSNNGLRMVITSKHPGW